MHPQGFCCCCCKAQCCEASSGYPEMGTCSSLTSTSGKAAGSEVFPTVAVPLQTPAVAAALVCVPQPLFRTAKQITAAGHVWG